MSRTRRPATPFPISIVLRLKSSFERHSVEPVAEVSSPCAYVSWEDWSESQVTWRAKKMPILSLENMFSLHVGLHAPWNSKSQTE